MFSTIEAKTDAVRELLRHAKRCHLRIGMKVCTCGRHETFDALVKAIRADERRVVEEEMEARAMQAMRVRAQQREPRGNLPRYVGVTIEVDAHLLTRTRDPADVLSHVLAKGGREICAAIGVRY
jgi:hypothetical protein